MPIDRLKSLIFPINKSLLKLKFVYLIFSSLWMAVTTYATLITTQIISYQQLAIIHAGVPVCSILAPIFIGFVADKIGNYNVILLILTFLGGLVNLPVLWLQAQHQIDPNLAYIFPVLLIIRLLGFILFDASQSLLDSCGMAMANKHEGDFGRQKMWSMASMIVILLPVGLMIDYISEYRGFKDYSSAFYFATGMSLIVLPLIYSLDVEVQKNEQSLIKTTRMVIGMIDVDVFLLVQVFVGICWGWHMCFFAVYINSELDASKTLLGGALSIGGISSITMGCIAARIIDKLGAPNTVAASLLITSVKFTVYYFLINRWLILAIELLDGACGFLGIVSGIIYCGAAAPAGMLASMNGLLTAAVFGAGKGLGLIIGSLLISSYGIRFSYLVLGILAGATCILYMIAYHSCLKKMEQARFISESSLQIQTTGL